MANSLADQLLKAGLVDDKKVKQAKKAKQKQQKVAHKSKQVEVDEAKLAAQQALVEKQEKSRALNKARETEAQTKAILAQIKQLIVTNIIRRDGDIAFNFVDDGKVKKLYVSASMQADLAKGRLAIAKNGDKYEIIPSIVADKIAQRDASMVIIVSDKEEQIDDDDPYADYQIPDDLMW